MTLAQINTVCGAVLCLLVCADAIRRICGLWKSPRLDAAKIWLLCLASVNTALERDFIWAALIILLAIMDAILWRREYPND